MGLITKLLLTRSVNFCGYLFYISIILYICIIILNTNIMKNVKDLRDDLIKTYGQLRKGSIGLSEAKELANVAGKIMSTAKLQLEYNKYAQSKSPIDFLNSSN